MFVVDTNYMRTSTDIQFLILFYFRQGIPG